MTCLIAFRDGDEADNAVGPPVEVVVSRPLDSPIKERSQPTVILIAPLEPQSDLVRPPALTVATPDSDFDYLPLPHYVTQASEAPKDSRRQFVDVRYRNGNISFDSHYRKGLLHFHSSYVIKVPKKILFLVGFLSKTDVTVNITHAERTPSKRLNPYLYTIEVL